MSCIVYPLRIGEVSFAFQLLQYCLKITEENLEGLKIVAGSDYSQVTLMVNMTCVCQLVYHGWCAGSVGRCQTRETPKDPYWLGGEKRIQMEVVTRKP